MQWAFFTTRIISVISKSAEQSFFVLRAEAIGEWKNSACFSWWFAFPSNIENQRDTMIC
jgi:hypothetical protein